MKKFTSVIRLEGSWGPSGRLWGLHWAQGCWSAGADGQPSNVHLFPTLLIKKRFFLSNYISSTSPFLVLLYFDWFYYLDYSNSQIFTNCLKIPQLVLWSRSFGKMKSVWTTYFFSQSWKCARLFLAYKLAWDGHNIVFVCFQLLFLPDGFSIYNKV